MADDLRRKRSDLLDVDQAVIPLSKLIHAPKYSASKETDYMADDIFRILRKKCVQELEIREGFTDS
jgi:hypothetical protein